MNKESMYNKAFWKTLRDDKDASQEIQNFTDSSNTLETPHEFIQDFAIALKKENLFRRIGTVVSTTAPEGKIYAVTSTGSAEWVDENIIIPESADAINPFTVESYKVAALTRLKNSFVADNKFNLEGYLKNEFAQRFGRAEENAFINGSGPKMPTGILDETKGASIGVTTAQITYDDVLKLFFSLNKHHRQNAVWLMNDETALTLRTLKDPQGNLLWNASNDTILNRPIEYSVHMPTINSGHKPLAFGDFSHFWIVERQPLRIKALNEKYILESQIGFAAYERLDGVLIDTDAVKLLKMTE